LLEGFDLEPITLDQAEILKKIKFTLPTSYTNDRTIEIILFFGKYNTRPLLQKTDF